MRADANNPVRVRIPWRDISAALDLLEARADGSFKAVVVGNHVCIDCTDERDADGLLTTFGHARKVPPAQ